MLIKIHKSYRYLVAICDNDLLGKNFEEGKRVLEIKNGFFGGDEVEESELIELMKNFKEDDATFNIAGEKSIKAALKAGIISREGIMKIQGVPFALVLL